MKLLDIIPVTGAGVITPEMERYINQYLSTDTQIDVVQITKGTPSIECEYDEAMCAPDIIEHCIEAEKAGYEGCLLYTSPSPRDCS